MFNSEQIQLIGSVKELLDILNNAVDVNLYGAGFYLDMFLSEITRMNLGYLDKIARIIVSDKKSNSTIIRNIKVVSLTDFSLHTGDTVILTLGERYVPEIYEKLKDTGASLYQLDFNMFQRQPYEDVKQSIQSFIDEFPHKITGLNVPKAYDETIAWTCWWQGVDAAPDIIKVCVKSQKRNLPYGVRQVVLSRDNYRDYIDIPQHILDKVDMGDITLVTLSDMIRASVLYKYGGFWLDATLYVSEKLESDIFEYPLYTRNLPGTQFCTNVMWSNWFLYSKKGNVLFQFLMEAFFYYYMTHDSIKYYFMVDYIIAIACNIFPQVEEMMKLIPYNNGDALELGKHLTEKFNADNWKRYLGDAKVHKLTYKIDVSDIKEDSIIKYLVKTMKL